MTSDALWDWWFARTGAAVRTIGVYERAMASRTIREASLLTVDDANAYYDWLSGWYDGVDMPALERYADRWAALKSSESPQIQFIRRHGGRW